MATNLKNFVTVVAVGAGLIGTPVTLWKTNVFATSQGSYVSQPEIRTITKKLDSSQTTRTTSSSGKCDVEELSKERRDFLLSKNQGGNFYVQISCIRTNEGNKLGDITTYSWTGLFPVELLSEGKDLLIGEKIDIKTKDSSAGGITKTNFKGKGIKGENVIGTWSGQSLETISFPEDTGVKNQLYIFPN